MDLNLPVAKFNSMATQSDRWAFLDRAFKYDYLFDKRKLFEYASQDYDMIRETMLSKKEVQEREQQMAQAQIRDQQMKAEQGQMEVQRGGGTSEAQEGQQGRELGGA